MRGNRSSWKRSDQGCDQVTQFCLRFPIQSPLLSKALEKETRNSWVLLGGTLVNRALRTSYMERSGYQSGQEAQWQGRLLPAGGWLSPEEATGVLCCHAWVPIGDTPFILLRLPPLFTNTPPWVSWGTTCPNACSVVKLKFCWGMPSFLKYLGVLGTDLKRSAHRYVSVSICRLISGSSQIPEICEYSCPL
jgi:hypothetical protein